MRRDKIETDYGYNDELGCTVWINCTDDKLGTKVMDKGNVLDKKWWEHKIELGKHIHKKNNNVINNPLCLESPQPFGGCTGSGKPPRLPEELVKPAVQVKFGFKKGGK